MKIITLCGSLKYQSEMIKEAINLTMMGNCVLTPIFPTNNMGNPTKDELQKFKAAHFKRIELSDAIYVVNKDKYIGDSTKKEIEYAKSLDKEIIYME